MKLDNQEYYAFVLGYEFFNYIFKNSSSPDCDITYNFCMKVAQKYLSSDYFKDTSCSGYEMFARYVEDNKIDILKEYEKFIGHENIYFNDNKKILELNYRGEQPVALVEWKRGSRMEYVIAVDYIIDQNELSWIRGYYYTNYEKAQFDFNRVKNGEYLSPAYKETDAR